MRGKHIHKIACELISEIVPSRLLIYVRKDKEKHGQAFHWKVVWRAVGVELGCFLLYLVVRAELVPRILQISDKNTIVSIFVGPIGSRTKA